MARWEPNAHERLQRAAMELFVERGYDRTTVSEIAQRAGLTERTFFRYFVDKRDVLFAGSADLEGVLVAAIASAPADAAPIDVIALSLAASSPIFEERRPFAQRRHALIVTHAELRERELIKLASLGAALATALTARGLEPPLAALVAELGITIFKTAFTAWIADGSPRDLADHIDVTLASLRLAMGPASSTSSATKPSSAKASAAHGTSTSHPGAAAAKKGTGSSRTSTKAPARKKSASAKATRAR